MIVYSNLYAFFMRNTREKLGIRIRELRKARGLTQQQLCDMVGVNRTYYVALEAGKSSPTIDLLEKIACGLGIGLEELFKDI